MTSYLFEKLRRLPLQTFTALDPDLLALNMMFHDRERADAWVALWIVRGKTNIQKRLALTSGWDRLP